ncbi:hypothetical protein N1851_018779 [Merluccius polli]|uniref:Uncharacterized protein n=1 Tax=Merluccius polli TaxID=89951 RepID=A0AA47NY24_MERPO|nr:hypothetical protein N1851_018779 [Merluccius polli]
MSILCRVAGISLRDRMRSSDIRRELGVEPLLQCRTTEVVRHLIRMPPGCLPLERDQGGEHVNSRDASVISKIIRERLHQLLPRLHNKPKGRFREPYYRFKNMTQIYCMLGF